MDVGSDPEATKIEGGGAEPKGQLHFGSFKMYILPYLVEDAAVVGRDTMSIEKQAFLHYILEIKLAASLESRQHSELTSLEARHWCR